MVRPTTFLSHARGVITIFFFLLFGDASGFKLGLLSALQLGEHLLRVCKVADRQHKVFCHTPTTRFARSIFRDFFFFFFFFPRNGRAIRHTKSTPKGQRPFSWNTFAQTSAPSPEITQQLPGVDSAVACDGCRSIDKHVGLCSIWVFEAIHGTGKTRVLATYSPCGLKPAGSSGATFLERDGARRKRVCTPRVPAPHPLSREDRWFNNPAMAGCGPLPAEPTKETMEVL